MARVKDNASVAAIVKLCPADAFHRLRSGPPVLFHETIYCRHKRGACLERCLSNAGADYCIGLALYLSDHEDVVTPATTMSLFALGCAQGFATGCTNRASIIRNTDTAGDPFRTASAAVKADCEYRSFAAACEADDSWGCAMVGQALERGEGTKPDLARAKAAFEKACTLADGSPQSPPCSFARSRIEAIETAKKSAEPAVRP